MGGCGGRVWWAGVVGGGGGRGWWARLVGEDCTKKDLFIYLFD